jgi:beta-glucanase (GH16 family)
MAGIADRFVFAVFLAVLCLAAPAGAQPPSGKDWALTFEDDFGGPVTNGELDGYALDFERWRPLSGTIDKILSERTPANLVYRGGMLRLVNRHETSHGKEWTSAKMESRDFRQIYGYYEARMRYAGVAGIMNRFSLHTDAETGPAWFGIDINDGAFPDNITVDLRLRGDSAGRRKTYAGAADLSRDFHVYGLEWLPGEDGLSTLNFYFDDRLIHSMTCALCNRPVKVILTTAVVGGKGPITAALDGKSMDVDYVRVYQLKPALDQFPPVFDRPQN